jgi:hypothetical protein
MAKGLTKPAEDLSSRVKAFITRWQGREGGQERANYALFRLCREGADFEQLAGVEDHELAEATWLAAIKAMARGGQRARVVLDSRKPRLVR